jgi:uncharacterized membrane protein
VFPFFKRKGVNFSDDEKSLIVQAVKQAEHRTSGEIRVFVESRCRFLNPLDRAVEVFHELKMEATEKRNAVLVYVALKDKQLAILGDAGIHEQVGDEFWNERVAQMIDEFNGTNYIKGISDCVLKIGEALAIHFPYDGAIDQNELSDEIVFGR